MTIAKLFLLAIGLLARFEPPKRGDTMMVHCYFSCDKTVLDLFLYADSMSGVLQGLIQSVFELHDGSGIVVTVGKYVTPNHKDINGNGIEPDYNRLPGSI